MTFFYKGQNYNVSIHWNGDHLNIIWTIPNNTHLLLWNVLRPSSLWIRVSIPSITGLDENRLCSSCWCGEYEILVFQRLVCADKASTHDWLDSRKQAWHLPCRSGTQETMTDLWWDYAGCGEDCPRASRRLGDQRKSSDFQIHVKWGKEARSLLTTSPGQQLPRYLYIR